MESLIGQRLGDYLLESELGQGSMGAVYAARHTSDGRTFAVKVLLNTLAADMMFVTRFTREARIIARLHHPNIVRVYEAGRQGEHLYFVMEYFPGVTVGSLLKERGRLPVGQAIEIAAQAADALDYAHREGRLVHRDIKPENLLVDRWCRVKMLDFGLARVEGLQSITRAGTVVGSLYYVSPEQLLGRPVDSRADIYALGVSLYEMVTGQRPYRGQNLTEMSRAILSGVAPRPSQLEPAVTPELERVIAHAMLRDPDKRYARASELCEDLRALQAAYPAPAESAGASQGEPPRSPDDTPQNGPFRRRTLVPVAPPPPQTPQKQTLANRNFPPRRPDD